VIFLDINLDIIKQKEGSDKKLVAIPTQKDIEILKDDASQDNGNPKSCAYQKHPFYPFCESKINVRIYNQLYDLISGVENYINIHFYYR